MIHLDFNFYNFLKLILETHYVFCVSLRSKRRLTQKTHLNFKFGIRRDVGR